MDCLNNTVAMRRFHWLFLLLSLAIVAPSCRKQSDPFGKSKAFDELVVPESFNWQTIKVVDVIILSPSAGVIQISSEDGNVTYYNGYNNLLEPEFRIRLILPATVFKLRINGTVYALTGNSLAVDLAPLKLTEAGREINIPPALVSYWHFDENSGTVINDQNGTNTGTTGATEWVQGVSQSALAFNGTSSTVVIPNSPSLNILSNTISQSLWFALPDDGVGGAFMFHNTKYIIRINSTGRLTFAVYVPTWMEVTTDYADRIIDNNWHHLVTTYDGSTLKIYVDGVLKKSAPATGNLKTTTANLILGNQSSVNFFRGNIDEVAVFNRALTQEEVLDLMASSHNPGTGEDALISYWKLDENTGTAFADSKGSNNGTGSNINHVTGVSGPGLGCNGSSSNVSVPHHASLNPSTGFTLMGWAKTSDSKTAKIAQKGDWDGYGLYQDKWNGWGAGVRLANSTNASITWLGGVPQLNEWYHLAMTFEASTLKLYVNGQLKNTVATATNLSYNTRPFSIGSDNGAQKFFNGAIDEVKVYSRALSQVEIQAAFQQTGNPADADGDGVMDTEDEYPADPARAFNNYYPAAGNGSLAFEDLWPGKGDYDFNDLVVDYRFHTVTNSANKIADIHATMIIRANGAGLRNGFGFQLPGNIAQADIEVSGYQLHEAYIQLRTNGTEANQSRPTVIVFDNVKHILQSSAGFGANVIPGLPYIQPDTIVIHMALKPGTYLLSDVQVESFNPFLIIDMNRGKEVHLPDFAPTSLADPAFFATMDDSSNPGSGRYYKTSGNLPWAINITQSFSYTTEQSQITSGHLKFAQWAETGGNLFADWYQNNTNYRNNTYIYQKPQ